MRICRIGRNDGVRPQGAFTEAVPVLPTGDQQVAGGEPGEQAGSVRGEVDFLLDTSRAPSVGSGPVRLDREDHALLELDRVFERVVPAHQRLFSEAETQAVGALQPEALL